MRLLAAPEKSRDSFQLDGGTCLMPASCYIASVMFSAGVRLLAAPEKLMDGSANGILEQMGWAAVAGVSVLLWFLYCSCAPPVLLV